MEVKKTNLQLKEFLSIIQSLNADLQTLGVAFPSCSHSRFKALPGLQSADTGVEMRSKSCARGLKGTVGALNLTHSYIRFYIQYQQNYHSCNRVTH